MSTPSTQTGRTEQDADPFRLGWRYVWQRGENGLMARVRVPLTPEDILHPQEEDFIVQRPQHDRDCYYLRTVLDVALNGRQGFGVVQDVRVDWDVKGLEPHGPDLVVFGSLPPGWDEWETGTLHVKRLGAIPLLVIEVTSPSTRDNDLGVKVVEYHRGGVAYYAIVDYQPDLPDRQVRILGYRWTPEGFVRLPLDDQGRLWLEPVRLWLGAEGEHAVCFDEQGQRMTGVRELVRGHKQLAMRLDEQRSMTEEAILERRDALRKLAQEEKARKEAEQKAADLAAKYADIEAELRRLRGSPPG